MAAFFSREKSTGFLEHAPGERSTGLLVAFLCGCSIAVVGFAMAFSIVYVSLHPEDRAGMAAIYAALGVPLGVIAGGAFAALRPSSETQVQQRSIAETTVTDTE